MTLYWLDPLTDPRWAGFLRRHPSASIFHTPGWLQALQQTYGYTPVAFTTSLPSTELTSGIVFCHVESWATGRRLVSLPFSDYCEPLADSTAELHSLVRAIRDRLPNETFKYAELRSLELTPGPEADLRRSEEYYYHRLALNGDLDAVYSRFHKDCVQRRIRRAEHSGLAFEVGASERLVRQFYSLFLLTRRRHQVPPPPAKWFHNLISCLGDQLRIHLVSKLGKPVAAILTLRFNSRLLCKYVCSDTAFNQLSGVHFLHWRAIQEALRAGLEQYEFGRTDRDNKGLVAFKERWGATRTPLTYWRYGVRSHTGSGLTSRSPLRKYVLAHTPDLVLRAVGAILYRHFG